jgi:hypothetical protein
MTHDEGPQPVGWGPSSYVRCFRLLLGSPGLDTLRRDFVPQSRSLLDLAGSDLRSFLAQLRPC